MKTVKALSLVLVCVSTLSGCASWFTPLGEDKYDCNRKENAKSPYCISFRGIEQSTQGSLPKSRYDKTVTMTERDKLFGIAPDDEDKPVKKDFAASTVNGSAALPHQRKPFDVSGMPVREAPVIQKVWIKRFVDENDTLVNSTTVYKEIRPTRWTGFDVATASNKNSGVNYPHKPAPKQAEASNKPLTSDAGSSQFNQPTSTGNSLAQPSASADFDGSLPK